MLVTTTNNLTCTLSSFQLICGERDGIPTFQLIELDEDDYMKHLGSVVTE